MLRRRRSLLRPGALWLAVALLAAPGCTLFDESLAPDKPEAAVTLTGTMNSDRIGQATSGCVPGGTVFWGTVTNTGDMNVADVSIAIDVFDAGGGGLGTWSNMVYNGDVDDTDPLNPLAGTSLEVDQSGSFKVCTTVPFGAAASTGYRTTFTIVEEEL